MVSIDSHEYSAAEGYLPQLLNAGGDSPVLLICEHATNYIPDEFQGLGLSDGALSSHIALDLGAVELSTQIALNLNAQLVVAGVSRLLYDCNRHVGAPDAIPHTSEVFDVPGNQNLTDTAKKERFDRIYVPFERLIEDVLTKNPHIRSIVTIHSFTPVFRGKSREVELGLLHDQEDNFAVAIKEASQASSELVVRLNEPYNSGDGVTHTLHTHGTQRGLESAMIEVRNDLLQTQDNVSQISELLSASIEKALSRVNIQQYRGR